MRQEKFEMAMSNVWFLMFGLSLGAFLIDSWFWWMPVFIIVCLVVARVLIRRIDRKGDNRGDKNAIYRNR